MHLSQSKPADCPRPPPPFRGGGRTPWERSRPWTERLTPPFNGTALHQGPATPDEDRAGEAGLPPPRDGVDGGAALEADQRVDHDEGGPGTRDQGREVPRPVGERQPFDAHAAAVRAEPLEPREHVILLFFREPQHVGRRGRPAEPVPPARERR